MTTMVKCHVEGTNTCNICHQQFGDGDDTCPQGHEIDQEYPINVPEVAEKPEQRDDTRRPTEPVECTDDNGLCSVCHQRFPEGDPICPQGHEIGQSYFA